MKRLCIQHWHVGTSLAISCRCQVWHLSSFPTLTESLPLLFHSHCPVWSCVFSFHDEHPPVGPHPLPFLHLYPLYSLATPLPPLCHVLFLCVFFRLFSFRPSSSLFFFPHVQPFTAQPHSPQLASFPSCSRCAPMDKGMNLVSCSTRTLREYILSPTTDPSVCLELLLSLLVTLLLWENWDQTKAGFRTTLALCEKMQAFHSFELQSVYIGWANTWIKVKSWTRFMSKGAAMQLDIS